MSPVAVDMHTHAHAGHREPTAVAERREPGARPSMARDPVCGMMVDTASALRSDIGGRSFYFCSSGCQRTFESPDEELRQMKRRVAIALTGVLVLAIMRVAVFLGLAAGATVLTWAPIDALPWFTWGVWMMILVTPVQFIGGASFYKGAYQSIRQRAINMDLLVALNREHGKTIIMVTHDPKAAEYATHTIHLDKGELADAPAAH